MLFRSLPRPRSERGAVGWIRANPFSTWNNSALTVVFSIALGLALWFGLGWIFFKADWTIIATLGGRLIIGQYNIDAACQGQNCFWRPQAALLLITILLGMAWEVAGGGLTKRIAIVVTGVVAAFAFLPYSFGQMGLDVRLLLLANLPALGVGWALAHFTRLGTAFWIAILSVVAFALTLLLLRGVPGVSFLQPV